MLEKRTIDSKCVIRSKVIKDTSVHHNNIAAVEKIIVETFAGVE